MDDLKIYEFIVGMREMIAKYVKEGVPMTAIYLAVNDIQREIIKPSMEQSIKKQMDEKNKVAEPVGEPMIRVVE